MKTVERGVGIGERPDSPKPVGVATPKLNRVTHPDRSWPSTRRTSDGAAQTEVATIPAPCIVATRPRIVVTGIRD